MSPAAAYLSPSDAAARLGTSPKALRLYEQRGLITPARTAAGWRVYGPGEMARAAEIVALRGLGLGLERIVRVLAGDPGGLEAALAQHQAGLEAELRRVAETLQRVRGRRAALTPERPRAAAGLRPEPLPGECRAVGFALPWPWGGEWFELRDVPPITFIVGPLGSGKTRLAERIAATWPGAAFLGLDRATKGCPGEAGTRRRAGLDEILARLVADGATISQALVALLAGLDRAGPTALVVDMVEQGLDAATQSVLIAHLRRRADPRPLFLMTRSSAILDLEAVEPDEAVLLCPANHSPPTLVVPRPGTPGYEAVATCLASPAVRARTEGVVAMRPRPAS